MASLINFLENLRPGGASNIPKSKFEQTITHDSDLESSEAQVSHEQEKVIQAEHTPQPTPEQKKKARKTIVKQIADVHQESSELDETVAADIPILESAPVASENPKPSPTPRQSLHKSQDSPNEDLRKVFQDRNVGQNGELLKDELGKMCTDLEMCANDKEAMLSLFVLIDTDKDNKVLMSEYLSGLKSNNQLKNAVLHARTKDKIKTRPMNDSKRNSDLTVSRMNGTSGLFSALDTNKKGFCEARKIVEFWASGGILNGNAVLEFLNFQSNKDLNLASLSVSLEQEMLMTDLDAITLAGIITYQKELQYSRSMIENMEKEKKKIFSGLDAENESKPTFTQDAEVIINELRMNKEELFEKIMKLNTEMSTIDFENSQLRSRMTELQEINLRQEEELDAVAELHRKDHMNELNQDSLALDGKLKMSERKVIELESKLKLKLDEVRYLKKELEGSQINQTQKVSESRFKEKEKDIDALTQRSEELKVENEMLRNKMHSLEGKVDIAINREKAYKMRIEANNEKEDQKSQNLEEIIADMKNKIIANTKTHEMNLEKNCRRIDELMAENIDLKRSCDKMENQLFELTEEMIKSNESHSKMRKKIENQKNEIDSLKDAVDSKNEDMRLNHILVNKLEAANDRLSKSLMNAVEKIDEFSKQNSDLDNKSSTYEDILVRKENLLLEDEVSNLNRKLAAVGISQEKEYKREIQCLQEKLKGSERKIEELEERLHKQNTDSQSDRFGSAKKVDQLQFKYEELYKKYHIQLEQVDKGDNLLAELYEENAKLVKSVQRSEKMKDQNESKIRQLEEKIQTLHNILNRNS